MRNSLKIGNTSLHDEVWDIISAADSVSQLYVSIFRFDVLFFYLQVSISLEDLLLSPCIRGNCHVMSHQ